MTGSILLGLRVAVLSLIVSAALLAGSGTANAACGKECREAKEFCSNWERDHPGQTCGRVRGAICTGSAWDKIKQVNWAWSACRLVEGGADHAKAQTRCDEYEDNWGGTCEVHSPFCNAGWARLGTYGKFRACRPREVSGDLLYDGYKAYMRKWEGKASTPIPAHLHFFIKREYGIDPDWVRWGTVPDTSNSTCITDCNRIYCDAAFPEQRVREGYNLHRRGDDGVTDLLFHELTHVQQCKEVGGRQGYAHLWFSNLSKGLSRAIRDGGKISADEIHNLQPMEQDATAKGAEIRQRYVAEWWHTKARCRVYLPDRTTVGYESNDTHPRAFCDPQVGWQGSKDLKMRAVELAKQHGEGTYHIAFGLPHESNGVWLGEVKVEHKILEAALGVNVSGQDCPRPVTLRVVFATEGPRKIRLRYRIGQDWSGWRQIEAKAASLVAGGSGYVASFEDTPSHHLDPGTHKVEVEVADYKTLVQDVQVTCPPFAALSANYAVRVEKGALCPREVDELVTLETNGPGTMRFGFRTKSGGKLVTANHYRAETKRSGNKYIAEFKATSNITDDFTLERRVETLGNAPVFSDWRTMKVDCIDILQSEIIYSGPDTGTCHYQTDVKLRVNTDMPAELPYRLDCTGGQSATGTFAVKQTGANTFIAVDTVKLNVTKTGKQICALKANLGAGFRNLTLQGRDFTCNDVLDAALFIDGPERARCPAELTVRARFNARDDHSIPYRLTCSTGQTWSGNIPMAKTGANTFIGVATEKLNVTKSGKIACSLSSKLTGASRVVAVRGKDFQCVAVTAPPSIKDLNVGGRPKPHPSSARRIVCTGGAVRRGECLCPRRWRKVQAGPNAWRCVGPAAKTAR
jgi:hypothetical protein